MPIPIPNLVFSGGHSQLGDTEFTFEPVNILGDGNSVTSTPTTGGIALNDGVMSQVVRIVVPIFAITAVIWLVKNGKK